jgi:hypothetical protein
LEKIVKVRKHLQTTSQPKKTSKTAAKKKKDAGNSDSDSSFVAPASRCTSKKNAKKKKEEIEKESEDIEPEDENTENAVVIKTITGRIVKRRIQLTVSHNLNLILLDCDDIVLKIQCFMW